MYSASPKVPGCRVFVLTTAGSPASWAFNLWKSVQDSPRWMVLHTTELPPWVDLAAVEDARLQLPEGIAERYFSNRWVVADEAPFTVEQIDAITMTEPPPKARNAVHFIGCDFGLTNDAACIAVVRQARSNQDEPHVLVKLWHRQGSRENPVPVAEFEETIERLRRDLHPTYVYADPWQLAGTIQRLRVEPFNFTSQGKTLISSSLTRLIRERRLLIPPDPGLRSELLNLTVRESSRGWGLEAATGHDDRAMALAIAAHHADLHPRGTERWRYAM